MTSCSADELLAPQSVSGRTLERPEFAVIFREQLGYVWHALRRLGVRDGDLEDVTHDVFLAVFRKLDDYDPERPLKPWLFGFACAAGMCSCNQTGCTANSNRDVQRFDLTLSDDGNELTGPFDDITDATTISLKRVE